MKKLIFLGICAIAVFAFRTPQSSAYPKLLKVIEVADSGIKLLDSNGFTWQYNSDPDDIEVGDYYSAVMNDNGTPKIFDDKIVSLRYERVDLF